MSRHGLQDVHTQNGAWLTLELRKLVHGVASMCGGFGSNRDRVRDFADPSRAKRSSCEDAFATLSLIAASPSLPPAAGAKIEQGLMRICRMLFVRTAPTLRAALLAQQATQHESDRAETMLLIDEAEQRNDVVTIDRAIECMLADRAATDDAIAAAQAKRTRMMLRNNSGVVRRVITGRPS